MEGLKVPFVLAAIALCGCISAVDAPQESFLLDVSPAIIEQGDSVNVSVRLDGIKAKELALRFGDDERKILCTENAACHASFTFTPDAGVYSVKAAAVLGNGKKIELSKRVVVESNSRSCAGNIAFGSCRGELYCDNGKLAKDCEKCGCPEGKYCSAGSCSPYSGPVTIALAKYPKIVQSGKPFDMTAVLVPQGQTGSGAEYDVQIAFSGKKTVAMDFRAQKALDANIEVKISRVVLPAGIYDIAISAAPRDGNMESIAHYSAFAAIESREALEPPQAPANLSAFAEGDDVVLEWQQAEGAWEYVLYKSSGASAQYISYKRLESYPQGSSTALVQGLEKGTHFFVVSAKDMFGNESKYSNIAGVRVG